MKPWSMTVVEILQSTPNLKTFLTKSPRITSLIIFRILYPIRNYLYFGIWNFCDKKYQHSMSMLMFLLNVNKKSSTYNTPFSLLGLKQLKALSSRETAEQLYSSLSLPSRHEKKYILKEHMGTDLSQNLTFSLTKISSITYYISMPGV